MSADRDQILKTIQQKSFIEGQQAEAHEYSASLTEQRVKATKKVVDAVSEVLDLTDEIARDGNPQKRRFASIIEARLMGAVEEATKNEGRGALEGAPFSQPSQTLETTSPESPKALPSSPPPKRPRGRPPKGEKP